MPCTVIRLYRICWRILKQHISCKGFFLFVCLFLLMQNDAGGRIFFFTSLYRFHASYNSHYSFYEENVIFIMLSVDILNNSCTGTVSGKRLVTWKLKILILKESYFLNSKENILICQIFELNLLITNANLSYYTFRYADLFYSTKYIEKVKLTYD